MGLIKAVMGAVGGTLNDQWKEYFYCEAMPNNVLVSKGEKKVKRGGNKNDDNIISNGSVIAVNEGQFMIIVENGMIVDYSGDPGEFVWDRSSEPSLFDSGSLGDKVKATFGKMWERFTFGGEAAKDQRVYFFNRKEITGNKYGTPNPVPFRVFDRNTGLDIDVSLRCHGEYSIIIEDPLLFYKNVSGNVESEYTIEQLTGQMRTELMTALQPAFAKISEMGIRYSSIPAHTMELADALNEVLSKRWNELRGIKIVSFGVSSMKASEEDEATIKEFQKRAALRDPSMVGATLASAQAEAMVNAAKNTNGAINGFMAMNMAGGGSSFNLNDFYRQPQQTQQTQQPAAQGWTCSCGAVNKGKFCAECGKPQPAPKAEWTCSCGAVNNGKFCAECGKPQPAPKAEWTCSCGAVNKGKFCAECGKPQPAAIACKCQNCGWEPEDKSKAPKFCPECGNNSFV